MVRKDVGPNQFEFGDGQNSIQSIREQPEVRADADDIQFEVTPKVIGTRSLKVPRRKGMIVHVVGQLFGVHLAYPGDHCCQLGQKLVSPPDERWHAPTSGGCHRHCPVA